MIPRILNRFSLHAAKWNDMVALGLILVWIMVIGCAISSILAQQFDRRQRIFWIAVVILAPGIGLLAYLPFAFNKEELPHMFQRKSKRSKDRKRSSAESSDA